MGQYWIKFATVDFYAVAISCQNIEIWYNFREYFSIQEVLEDRYNEALAITSWDELIKLKSLNVKAFVSDDARTTHASTAFVKNEFIRLLNV